MFNMEVAMKITLANIFRIQQFLDHSWPLASLHTMWSAVCTCYFYQNVLLF